MRISLAILAAALLLAGCQTTASVPGIPNNRDIQAAYSHFQSRNDYKAFAVQAQVTGRQYGSAGWVAKASSPEQAISEADHECQFYRKEAEECETHTLGNIVVWRRGAVFMAKATEMYRDNKATTTVDVEEALGLVATPQG